MVVLKGLLFVVLPTLALRVDEDEEHNVKAVAHSNMHVTHSTEDNESLVEVEMAAPGAGGGSSCEKMGCGYNFKPAESCQCNPSCDYFGDCCKDFEKACSSGIKSDTRRRERRRCPFGGSRRRSDMHDSFDAEEDDYDLQGFPIGINADYGTEEKNDYAG
eukprot:TRINITY_DN103820_c0_g1_i1.p2 TRINITY_DN103820_c0_g1~~TRINITY_DN103820_c0_g1_i1.p2  ORF type:complete len:160 (-),score=34.13 TRINITY_DN103820_c0_g1_i1:43-522(-)